MRKHAVPGMVQGREGELNMIGKIPFLITSIFCLAAPGWVFSQSPPALQAEGTPPLSLAKLVQEATERNPEILAARRAVEAKRARVPQAGAWADPTVTLSYGGNALPPFTVMRSDPSSARQVMAEQMIPYPGKTRLRTEIARRDADAETLAYEAVARRVAAEVKQAYFDLAYIDRSLAILAEGPGGAGGIREGHRDPLFGRQGRAAGCFARATGNHSAFPARDDAHRAAAHAGSATQQPA